MTGGPRISSAQGEAYDASDPAQIKKAEAAAAQRIEDRKRISALLLDSREGREWLWQLLQDCGTWEKTILAGDAYGQGFEDGKREIGLSLTRHLSKSNPQQFANMIVENDRA